MAQKKALTDEELLAQFESLEGTNKPKSSSSSTPKPTPKPSSKPAPSAADDPLAELESLAKARPASRPGTPKVVTQAAAATPGSTPRTSEEGKTRTSASVPRKSGESARGYHQGLTPTSEEERQEEALKAAAEAESAAAGGGGGGGGGGWGGWFSGITASASAAVKQAEAYAKEIQKNEEAQKWTEQLKGRVGDLRGLGMFNCYLPSHSFPMI
jgi:hypothetical protein